MSLVSADGGKWEMISNKFSFNYWRSEQINDRRSSPWQPSIYSGCLAPFKGGLCEHFVVISNSS